MLVANINGQRIEAKVSSKELACQCPNCSAPVVLKKGRIKIPHFAHKAKQSCEWSAGETAAHLQGKAFIDEAFRSRDIKSEVEYVINGRRADIMIWKKEKPIAIELQHTSIDLREIEKRSFDYAKQEIAQIWMPFIKAETIERALKREDGSMMVKKYSPRPFERWIHGFHGGKIFFYQTDSYLVWEGSFKKHEIWVEESEWYEPGGFQMTAGGYHRISKRWKDLILKGPYNLFRAPVIVKERIAWSIHDYNWPTCSFVEFA